MKSEDEVREAWRMIFYSGDMANAAEEALVETLKRPLSEQINLQVFGARALEILHTFYIPAIGGVCSIEEAEECILTIRDAARSLGLLGEEVHP